jgi:hypothetical protein
MKFLLALFIGFWQRRPFEGAWPIQVMDPELESGLMIPRVSDGSHSFFRSADVASQENRVELTIVDCFFDPAFE